MLAVGIDTRGNPVNLDTGEDFIAAQAALDAAAQAGASISDTSSKIRQQSPCATARCDQR